MKEELRQEMKRKLLSIEEDVYLPVGIQEDCIPQDTKTLFTFLSHGKEIDTSPLVGYALNRGITVAAPRVTGSRMSFHRIESETGPFRVGAYGIREPPADAPQLFPMQDGITEKKMEEIQFPLLVLVPGLAFSFQGDRLGRGAGYYDRFLSSLFAAYPHKRNLVTLAGVCYSFQITGMVPVETHDIPVDCIITEKGCIVCI